MQCDAHDVCDYDYIFIPMCHDGLVLALEVVMDGPCLCNVKLWETGDINDDSDDDMLEAAARRSGVQIPGALPTIDLDLERWLEHIIDDADDGSSEDEKEGASDKDNGEIPGSSEDDSDEPEDEDSDEEKDPVPEGFIDGVDADLGIVDKIIRDAGLYEAPGGVLVDQSLPAGRPLGRLRFMQSRDVIICTTCSAHTHCKLVMNGRTQYAAKITASLAWLKRGIAQSVEDHHTSSADVKLSFGIKARKKQ